MAHDGQLPSFSDKEPAIDARELITRLSIIRVYGTASMGNESWALAASDLDAILFDKIGAEALRMEQPKVSYEDKRQLLLDFSQSILGRGDESIIGAGDNLGRLGSLQVIAQRLATDLAENLQVGFLGETIKDSSDLAYFAQALRNPRFETFLYSRVEKAHQAA